VTEKHAAPSRLTEWEGASITCNFLAAVGRVVIALDRACEAFAAFGKAPRWLEYTHLYENGRLAGWDMRHCDHQGRSAGS